MSNIPTEGTKQWIKNERLINETPVLKKARDKAQGLDNPNKTYTTGAGKGSSYRPVDKEKFDANWDRIFGKKDKS
jgi:hypothetical protein